MSAIFRTKEDMIEVVRSLKEKQKRVEANHNDGTPPSVRRRLRVRKERTRAQYEINFLHKSIVDELVKLNIGETYSSDDITPRQGESIRNKLNNGLYAQHRESTIKIRTLAHVDNRHGRRGNHAVVWFIRVA